MQWSVSSLEGKLTLLMAAIALVVVGTITYWADRLTLGSVERDLLETASELAAAIASRLGSGASPPETLQQVLLDCIHSNSEVDSIAVFSVSSSGRLVPLASAGAAIEPLIEQQSAVDEQKQVGRQITLQGERWWSVGIPVISEGRIVGAVGVWSSLRTVDRMLHQNHRRALAAAPLSVALIILMLRLVFNRLVRRPLRHLELAMARAEAGDLQAQAPIVRRDELGAIASRYNAMLARVRTVIEEREDLHERIRRFNEELSERVTEATDELQQKNRQLQRLNAELYHLQRRLTRIERLTAAQQTASRFAHKIGTPLNLISGHIQMLQQSRQDDWALREKLRLIQSQIERLTTIVHDILDETRKPVLDRKSLDLNRLLDGILALVEPVLSSRGVTVEMQLDTETARILGDEVQLEQVFLSLLGNSLDAMPGGGSITVETERVDRTLRVRFKDTGEGIPESVLPQLFRPFFTTKEAGRGTGLGLAIAQEILSAHGASIKVKSGLGQGTEFQIDFPFVDEVV